MKKASFEDAKLGITFRYPSSWRVIPPAWSPIARLKNQDPTDPFAQLASLPKVTVMGPEGDPNHVLPTVQLIARGAIPLHTAQLMAQEGLKLALARYEEVSVIEPLGDAIIAGFPAFSSVYDFVLEAERNGLPLHLPVRTRSLVLLAAWQTVTIGLSASANPRFDDAGGFALFLESFRMNKP